MKKLNTEDRAYWENPVKFALLKEDNKEYTIFSRRQGKLMMSLIDDYEYAQMLSQKMLSEGVVVFETMDELKEWAKNQ